MNLETSLPVPSVHELSLQLSDTVPHRYIRDDVYDLASDSCNTSLEIPSVDMAKLMSPESRDTELQKLHSACKDWGTFQLINHGASNDIIEKMTKQLRDFFTLPSEEKQRCAQRPGSLEGYGQAFVVSEDQKLEWNDMIFLKSLPIKNRNFDLWPENPPDFRETFASYSEEIRRTTVSILGFISMSIGLEAHQFSDDFRQGMYEVRMNYYPPCPQPELVIGISQHSDISGITLLLNCDGVPGLQVQKDGCWVPLEPIANSITVTLGDSLEIMSNGIYKSSKHRAVVNKMKERMSIATFCYPKEDAEIGPAPELTKPEHPALFKTLTTKEYFHAFYNRKGCVGKMSDLLKIDASP